MCEIALMQKLNYKDWSFFVKKNLMKLMGYPVFPLWISGACSSLFILKSRRLLEGLHPSRRRMPFDLDKGRNFRLLSLKMFFLHVSFIYPKKQIDGFSPN